MGIGARMRETLANNGVKQQSFADSVHEEYHTVNKVLTSKRSPSIELLIKFIDYFPETNIRWLLFGSRENVTQTSEPGESYEIKPTASKIAAEIEQLSKELQQVLAQI